MNSSDNPPLIWLIAGEPSGDLIGARLIAELRALRRKMQIVFKIPTARSIPA